MTSYYANHHLTAYEAQLTNDEQAVAAWQAQTALQQQGYELAVANWQEAHDAWEARDGSDPDTGEPTPEPVGPVEPEPIPAPLPTAVLPSAFTRPDITEPTQIQTEAGEALVIPPRIVLTELDTQAEFALSEDELAAHYTDTTAR